MALAGLPEDLAKKIHEAQLRRPERERQKRISNEQVPRASQPMQKAEALVEKRVATCDLLFRALRLMAKTLATAGRELQRTSASTRNDWTLKSASEADLPPFAEAGLGVLEACNSLGSALTCLSTTFSSELLEALHGMRRSIRGECSSSLSELVALEQQEEECAEAVREGTLSKDKLAAELQSAMESSKEVSKGGGFANWLRKDASSRLNDTAQQQREAVEELARRIDRSALACMRRKESSDAFQALLQRVDERAQSQLQASIKQCTSVWDDAMESFERASQLFHGGAAGDSLPTRKMSDLSNLTNTVSCFTEDNLVVEARDGFLDTPSGSGADCLLGGVELSLLEEDAEAEDEEIVFGAHRADRKQEADSAAAETAEPGSAGGSNSPQDSTSRSSGSTPRLEAPTLPAEAAYEVAFGSEVKKLGFEVLWEAEWPSIIMVLPEGQARRAGVCRGDLLEEIGDTCTRGKGRDELMPLLKARPLQLRLNTCRRKAETIDGGGIGKFSQN